MQIGKHHLIDGYLTGTWLLSEHVVAFYIGIVTTIFFPCTLHVNTYNAIIHLL